MRAAKQDSKLFWQKCQELNEEIEDCKGKAETVRSSCLADRGWTLYCAFNLSLIAASAATDSRLRTNDGQSMSTTLHASVLMSLISFICTEPCFTGFENQTSVSESASSFGSERLYPRWVATAVIASISFCLPATALAPVLAAAGGALKDRTCPSQPQRITPSVKRAIRFMSKH